jgi:hypothetical protein
MDREQKYKDELIAFIKSTQVGGTNPIYLTAMQARGTLLLYESNIKLAESSGRLATRNLWLTVAVLGVALLQVWIAVRYPPTVITLSSAPA